MTRLTVAALAVVVTLAGCGGGDAPKPAPKPRATRVTLDLKGGTNEAAAACGTTHHFAVLSAAKPVRFGGDVKPVPSGRWKVKLKVKVCRAGSFQDLTKVEASRDKSTGHYSGSFTVGPGRYFARASLYVNGKRVARSDKRHFSARR